MICECTRSFTSLFFEYHITFTQQSCGELNPKRLNGTWRNSHGYQLVFNNGTITAPVDSAENTQNYSLVSPTDASNVLFVSFSPAPLPNGMSIMVGLKGSPAEVSGNSDETDTTKDRILMGNNGGTLLFAPKDQGGIPDTAYYRE